MAVLSLGLSVTASASGETTETPSDEAIVSTSPRLETQTDNADIDDYSNAFGVSSSQTLAEWDATETAGQLQVALAKDHADVFAGLWIEHEPHFAVVVSVLPRGEDAAKQEIDSFGLSALSRIETAQYTLERLAADQALVDQRAPVGVVFASGVLQPQNRVEVSVATDADLAALQKISLPQSVILMKNGVPFPTLDVFGGLPLTTCTSGYSVEETGTGTREGVTTAGHCQNSQAYLGNDLPWQNGQYNLRVDAQWHTSPSMGDPNRIRVSSDGTTRQVTARKTVANMVVGEHVCKYGKTSYFACGTIRILGYNPGTNCVPNATSTYVLVYPNDAGIALSDPGDSGMPWFHGAPATAYGVGNCGTTLGDGIFMPQQYLPDIGVRVDITSP